MARATAPVAQRPAVDSEAKLAFLEFLLTSIDVQESARRAVDWLVAHTAVLECGVVGREDRDALVKPMAFVVLRDGTAGTPDLAMELQQFVRERLAEYKRPRWVAFVPELPKTATGKIQRFRLRALAGKTAATTGAAGPR